MYAVVRAGGKQYQVSPGDTFRVEKLAGEPGETIEIDDVLLVSDGASVTLGTPRVPGASVSCEIVEQGRNRKVVVYKFRRRKRYRRKMGHRQPYTALKVTGISSTGSAASEPAPAPAEPEPAASEPAARE